MRRLLCASRFPVAGLAATAHRAGHGIAVNGSGVVERDACGDVEFYVFAVDGASDRSGLAWPFEGAGDFAAVLSQRHRLLGVARASADIDGPTAGGVCGLVLSWGGAGNHSEKNN